MDYERFIAHSMKGGCISSKQLIIIHQFHIFSCVFSYCFVPCEEEPSAFSVGCQPCDTHQGVGGRKGGLDRGGRQNCFMDRLKQFMNTNFEHN